ncbi:MAG TPA: hypothetical protein DC084_32385, partial [Cupriavidus sp.]|nr:hypothetical protein [Cupriavidus sp.]
PGAGQPGQLPLRIPHFHRVDVRITYDSAFRAQSTIAGACRLPDPMALKSTIFKADLSVSDMDR